jgi:hypothetical protein
MRWDGHVALCGRWEVYTVWWGKLRDRDYLKHPGVDERTTLKVSNRHIVRRKSYMGRPETETASCRGEASH